MKIEMEVLDGGIVKVKLAGRMDAQGTEGIEQKLMDYAGTHRSVILDMNAVDFLTSAGIRTLILAAKAVSRRGGKMVLLNLDAKVRQVLEIANLDKWIPMHQSLQEAPVVGQVVTGDDGERTQPGGGTSSKRVGQHARHGSRRVGSQIRGDGGVVET